MNRKFTSKLRKKDSRKRKNTKRNEQTLTTNSDVKACDAYTCGCRANIYYTLHEKDENSMINAKV